MPAPQLQRCPLLLLIAAPIVDPGHTSDGRAGSVPIDWLRDYLDGLAGDFVEYLDPSPRTELFDNASRGLLCTLDAIDADVCRHPINTYSKDNTGRPRGQSAWHDLATMDQFTQ